MVVSRVSARDFRSYAQVSLDLAPGLVLLVGPNGAGKTNLLEAVHVAGQGFSFRTRRDGAVVRLGEETARVELAGVRSNGTRFAVTSTIDRAGRKRFTMNGAAVESQDELRRQLAVLAFTPDRLVVVKGPPAVRRLYLDRVVARLLPSRARVSGDYARALAQRNAALRRAAHGSTAREELAPWDEAVVRLGAEVEAARMQVTTALAARFGDEAERFGLPAAALGYTPSELTIEALGAMIDRDLERGTTGCGPHLQDLSIEADGAELRTYGSQGQQRLGVLALLLAEAQVLTEDYGNAPVLLLDDALSELDDRRSELLLAGVPSGTQVLVTATTERALAPTGRQPDQIVDVRPGVAEPR